ncbi:uncharacterized protein LOC107040123 [Diachasma alloeum]|uniref:uncharacterized protein LOC107040123 n=1 Tax=Diachasma alloeum TaxID=454923 RepID=UPI00073845E8|nr:uncharacterized protein LOC107040123 [Diachasma alloeum]
MAAEGNPPILTSNEEFDEIEIGDNMVDVTAAIIREDQFRQRAETARNVNQPYRCIMSNLSGRSLRFLIWGRRIPEFQGRLIRHFVRIIRARAQESNPLYRIAEDNLLPIELFVQPQTTVSILGPMPEEVPRPLNYTPITFNEVGQATGTVSLTGFIKLPIERVITNNATYGNGILTDAQRFRISVYVTSFEVNTSPPLGSHVTVNGVIRRNGNQAVVLQVANMDQITLVDDTVLTEDQMRAGYRLAGRVGPAPDINPIPNVPAERRPLEVPDAATVEETNSNRQIQRRRLDPDEVQASTSENQAEVVTERTPAEDGRGV